jgi:hypothetical protein
MQSLNWYGKSYPTFQHNADIAMLLPLLLLLLSGATKAAFPQLAATLRAELASTHVGVHVLSPGELTVRAASLYVMFELPAAAVMLLQCPGSSCSLRIRPF